MGIRFLDEASFGPAAALGATEVRLLDMMEVYGTLANNGQFVGLHTLASITDVDGNSVAIPPLPTPQQVVDPHVAFLMQHILSDDASRAQAFGRNSALTLPEFSNQAQVAAKSGTTDGRRDLWTMGFTRNYVVGVWLGTFDDAQTFGNLTGSTAAGPVWNQVLRAALNGQSPPVFSAPQDGTNFVAEICPLTGAINGECSAQMRNEWFARSRPPADALAGQGLVQSVMVDSWTGLLANNFCPQNQVVQTFTTIDHPPAIEWINNTGAGQAYARSVNLTVPVQRPPTQECDINTPIPNVNVTTPVPNEVVQGAEYVLRGQINVTNLARYEIHIAPAGTVDFQPVPGIPAQTQAQTNPNSPLATWNTTLVQNGNYTLRLAVYSQSGGYLYRDVPVTINNPLPTATPAPLPTQPPLETTPIPFDTLPAQESQNVGPSPTLDTSF
jgi:membrane peptidoglycan carboxypeptidase